MSTYSVTFHDETIQVTFGVPEDPIMVDGQEIGRQSAEGACRADRCILIAAAYTWPEAGDFAAGTDAWDALSYIRDAK